ncbi:growth-regulating factor 6-like [Aristolochia californica]|uniref:growth-regulating factor 6-like n=1 Tax=Aristolochia californica TaxID=171875 RepID=UPI0035DC492D
MDFGVVGFDGLVSSESGFPSLVSDGDDRQKCFGSGYLKQGRSGVVEDDWRSLKMAKTDTMLLQSRTSSMVRSNSLLSDQQQHLLSFSSPKNEALVVTSDGLADRSLQSGSFSFYPQSLSYGRNTAVGSGSLNGSMPGTLSGVRGPFTPSQWIELEHQALIYKYLNANVPIPSNLLIPIRRSLNPSGFSAFPPGSLRPNSLGWGSFHLGFSGNTDPEPGRCRRTDGKKWRCSRDAVADQKYCERHMNRGRHRSRKPVEGHSGHAASGPAATVPNSQPISSSAPVAGSASGTSNSLAAAHHQQIKSMQTGPDPPSASNIGRILMNKSNVDERMQDSHGLSFKDSSFPVLKQHIPFEEPSRAEFGLISSDSLMNPVRNSYVESRSFNSSPDREPQSHSLRHFIDDWPKSRPDRSSLAWPEVEEIQSDRTQLSISIPVASSDFSSSSSSPTHEKLTLSPLKLSRELDPIQMGLGVGGVLTEGNQRQTNWIPITWESSMGGPLGEVLNKSGSNPKDHKNSSSALNLMTDGWDTSPRLGSSPTGVLQKTTFGSLSNSSAGSSPRTENKSQDVNTSICDDLLGSTLVNSSIPSL